MTINNPNFQWGGVPAREVSQFHDSSDVDSSVRAQHHTLGNGPTQAAPGDHDHADITTLETLTGTLRQTGLAPFNPLHFSVTAKVYEISNFCLLVGTCTALLAHGANTAVLVLPVGWRPPNDMPSILAFQASDGGTGSMQTMYLDNSGALYHSFARAAGAVTYFSVAYAKGS